MKELKQVVGIDVAQKELVTTLGRLHEDLSVELFAHRVFKNSASGFEALLKWVKKLTNQDVGVRFVMEATGVYHQKLSYYLHDEGQDLSIVLPNKISNYLRTLETKTITDKTCSEAITRFGLERKLDSWKRPEKVYTILQQLTRERDQIVFERSAVKNQLHAESAQGEPHAKSLARMAAHIKFLNAQEKEIKEEIEICLKEESLLNKQIEKICTIPGVGKLTAVIVLAETNGFELIRNKKQLVSYAGFDIKEKQSGTSVKGKARISKKGNRSLRKAMHLPSLTAVKWDDRFKGTYTRLVSKHGIKMKALIAVQRKLLELIYTLFKNDSTYDKSYIGSQKDRVQIQIV